MDKGTHKDYLEDRILILQGEIKHLKELLEVKQKELNLHGHNYRELFISDEDYV